MTPLATLVCGAMICCGVVGVLTAARLRHGRVGALLADVAMLAAMIDVCLLGARVLAPVFWAALLLIVALATLVGARRLEVASRGPIAAHAFALVVSASTLMVIGSGHAEGNSATVSHHGEAGLLVLAVVIATGVHGALAVGQARSASRGSRRVPIVRASAAVVGSVAMGTLALLGAG